MPPLAITMGCPAGIGPEIILKYFSLPPDYKRPDAVVIGDCTVLSYYADKFNSPLSILPWSPGDSVTQNRGVIPVYESSHLAQQDIHPGIPSAKGAVAMADAIIAAVNGIRESIFSALCTCPISKKSLQESGHHYPGHTEMLAALTASPTQVMMMAGSSLRITLATIHCALTQVPELLQEESLIALFSTTHQSLKIDFDIATPKIAVAALNPHAGEEGMFGDEEKRIIVPAMKKANEMGIDLHGPFPPDTIFFKAAQGQYDAVVCMYHDQGLIPFKLLHFKDGVNVTLGLPIVRTSVDHGTAYDIAGKFIADPASLMAAAELATIIAANRARHNSPSPVI